MVFRQAYSFAKSLRLFAITSEGILDRPLPDSNEDKHPARDDIRSLCKDSLKNLTVETIIALIGER
jgi:hypothetical protein